MHDAHSVDGITAVVYWTDNGEHETRETKEIATFNKFKII